MNKNQLLALAAFITSLANDGECSTTTETAPGGEAPPVKRRGRPPTTAAPPETVEKPAEPEKEKPADEQPAGSKTIDDMRALIQPLIKGQWMPGWKEGDPVQPRGGRSAPYHREIRADAHPDGPQGLPRVREGHRGIALLISDGSELAVRRRAGSRRFGPDWPRSLLFYGLSSSHVGSAPADRTPYTRNGVGENAAGRAG